MKVSSPLVSILMPAYNHEKYVEAAVRSVWTMDYSNLELIIVNDGSVDATGQILDKLVTESPISMRVFHQQNKGICAALNAGLAYVSGKYVAIMATDDMFPPNRIGEHVNLLEANGDELCVGCYGNFRVMTSDGKITETVKKSEHLEKREALNMLFLGDMGRVPFNLQTTTLVTSVVRKIKFDEELFFEDLDFFINLYLAGYYLKSCAGDACFYRLHEGGAHKKLEKMSRAMMAIYSKYQKNKQVIEFGVRNFKSNFEYHNASVYFKNDDYSMARVWLWRAFKTKPERFLVMLRFALKLILGRRVVEFLRDLKK